MVEEALELYWPSDFLQLVRDKVGNLLLIYNPNPGAEILHTPIGSLLLGRHAGEHEVAVEGWEVRRLAEKRLLGLKQVHRG